MRFTAFFLVLVAGLLIHSRSIAEPISGNAAMDNPSVAGDVCISTLATSSPGEAAGLAARKTGVQKQAIDHFKKGRGEGPVDEADAQITAKEAAEGAQIGGDYTQSSSPVFAAGAAKELDPAKKAILMACAQRRSAQGSAQNASALANRRVAGIAIREDSRTGKADTTPENEAPKLYRIVDPNVFSGIR